MHDPFPPGLLALVVIPAVALTLWWSVYYLPRALIELFYLERKWKLPKLPGRWIAARPWKFRRRIRVRRYIRRRKNMEDRSD